MFGLCHWSRVLVWIVLLFCLRFSLILANKLCCDEHIIDHHFTAYNIYSLLYSASSILAVLNVLLHIACCMPCGSILRTCLDTRNTMHMNFLSPSLMSFIWTVSYLASIHKTGVRTSIWLYSISQCWVCWPRLISPMWLRDPPSIYGWHAKRCHLWTVQWSVYHNWSFLGHFCRYSVQSMCLLM